MLDITTSPGRILHFDAECRPLTFWVPDQPTTDITAISSAWADDIDGTIKTVTMGPRWTERSYKQMLKQFVERYNEASIVTGHYILRFDIPLFNSALIEMGMPVLEEKLVSDTKIHLAKYQFLPKTQEHVSGMMRTMNPKEHMTQEDWREANRLTPKGITETRRRVEGDVRQHYQMRAELISRGLLKAPSIWRP
jgi:hypothetical protein